MRAAGFVGSILLVAASAALAGAGLADADREAVAAVSLAYRDAWRANDAARVMATLAPDAVLLPSGMEPIAGEEAIRRFWWPPDSPPVKITSMEQSIDEVSGSGDLAFVRGHGELAFTMTVDGKNQTRSQRSTFLNVLRRAPDGSWKIAVRMWSDLR